MKTKKPIPQKSSIEKGCQFFLNVFSIFTGLCLLPNTHNPHMRHLAYKFLNPNEKNHS